METIKEKDSWQNLLEQYGFKKGASKYGLDMYYNNGYIVSVDKNLKNVDLMFEDDVLYKGYSVEDLSNSLDNQFKKNIIEKITLKDMLLFFSGVLVSVLIGKNIKK